MTSRGGPAEDPAGEHFTGEPLQTGRASAATSSDEWARRWLPLVVFVVLAAAFVAAVLGIDQSMRQGARRRAEAELDAVATLKLKMLADWRNDQVERVQLAAGYPSVRRLLVDGDRGGGEGGPGHVAGLLADLGRRYGFERIALFDRSGRQVLEEVLRDAPGGPFDPALVHQALAVEGPVEALVATPAEGRPRFDALLPVSDAAGATVGALAIRMDMRAILVPLTEGWPVPSRSARTVFARQDGDAAIFITDAAGRPGTALKDRVGMDDVQRGVVQAVRWPDRILEAPDYRGTMLYIAVRRVPDSDWVLFTRIERAEVLDPIVGPVRAIAVLLGAVLLVGALALAVWWRRERSQHRALAAARGALQASEERLRLALEAGSMFVWEWDLEAGRLVHDPRWAAALGRTRQVLEGPWDDLVRQLVHPDDVAAVLARFEPLIAGREAFVESEHRSLGAGEERWVKLAGRVTRAGPDGRALRLTGLLQDVTRERALRGQLERSERMASLGTLTAGVAHEINNPLSYVFAALDTLRVALPEAAPARGDLLDAVAHAWDGVERVRDVVKSLKAFSRPPGGPRAPVDVGRELESAVRIASHQARHRARLEVDLGPLPPVAAAASELGQVFLNLLVNAIQAVPEGDPDHHRIDVVARTDPDGWARVEVRDTGSGIPAELLPRIFEPFFTTRSAVGTGLGLAIAQGVVASAGGRIEVESRLGRGSTFRVRLPPAGGTRDPLVKPSGTEIVVDGVDHVPGPRSASTPAPHPQGARPRVLVIDDEPLVARAVGRALGAAVEVDTVGSAADALARLEAGERYDAFVCDLMMPHMNGMALYDRVAARDEGLARRFVFVTGGAVTEEARRFVAARGDRCVEKPFEVADLRAAVERAARG